MSRKRAGGAPLTERSSDDQQLRAHGRQHDHAQPTAGDAQRDLDRLGGAMAALREAERNDGTDVGDSIRGPVLSKPARLAVLSAPGDVLLRTRPYRGSVDRCGLIPVDRAAEECVGGIAVASRVEAERAMGALSRADFYDLRIFAVIEAAADVPDDRDGDRYVKAAIAADAPVDDVMLAGLCGRVDAIAARTGDPSACLRQLLDRRLAAADPTCWFAGRVKAAALERLRVRVLLAELDRIGVDLDPLLSAEVVEGRAVTLVATAARALGELLVGDRDDPAERVAEALRDMGALFGLTDDDVVAELSVGMSLGVAA